MKKNLIVLVCVSFCVFAPLHAQAVKELSTNGIALGNIFYYENCSDTADMILKADFFKKSKIVLKNKTTNTVLNIQDAVIVDSSMTSVFVKFHDELIKGMQDCQFLMLVNNAPYASSDSTSESNSSKPLSIDIKPSLDLSKSQELDIVWTRNLTAVSLGGFAGNVQLQANGKFSTKPDSAALNSIQWSVGYQLIWGNAGIFKYVALSGKAGGQHPQDFSQTDVVGTIVLSSLLPWTDVLARVFTNNQTDASVGLLIQPAIDVVKKTTVSDSSFTRGAIHTNWEIPLFEKQYADIYSVVYFQSGYRPRSYIEVTLIQKLSSSLSVIAKWVNGGLPPLFNRTVDFRIGLKFQ